MDENSSENSSDKDSSAEGSKESDEDDSYQEITNKSLDSGPSELQAVVNPQNYKPYISDRFENKHDILEEIDKNERSFKMVAEKMISKLS